MIEVNEVDVTQESHKQVVQRIRELPSGVTLMVVNNECNDQPKEPKIKGNDILPHVILTLSKREQSSRSRGYRTMQFLS